MIINIHEIVDTILWIYWTRGQYPTAPPKGTMKHRHHITPRHMGGGDSDGNYEYLTIEEHAEAHRRLYEEHDRWQDFLAWKGLSGQIGKEELLKIFLSEAGKKGNATRKVHSNRGMKYRPYTKSKGSTEGLKWFHNLATQERGCFRPGEEPEGWLPGQARSSF